MSRARCSREQWWISTSQTALVLMAAILLSSGAWAGDINPVLLGGPHVMPKRANGAVITSAPSGAHLTYFGGRVVSNLHVIQVLWGAGAAGSADGQYLAEVVNTTAPSMASFYQAVLNSPYVDWLSEYDTNIIDNDNEQGTNQIIGHGSFVEQVTITPSNTSNPIDDGGIQTELANQIAAGHLPAPTTDAAGNNNTYYAVFFPHGLVITQGTETSCARGGFCAYHNTIGASGGIGEFYYGVHPDMQTGSGCDTGCGAGATFFDNQTSVASHEMVETITDGEVGLAANTFDAPLAWYDMSHGEIGDICNGQQGAIAGYTVQLEFSNVVGNCIVSRVTTTPTPTATATATATRTATATSTFTPTATQTVTATATPTATRTATATPTATATLTQTATSTPTATATATRTATSTATATQSATATATFTATTTATQTATSTVTRTATATPTATATATQTATSTPTATGTATQTATSTVTATQSATATATSTATQTAPTATETPTQTATSTATATLTATATATSTQTATATPTATATATQTATSTATLTRTATPTSTTTATQTATATASPTPTATATATETQTPTPTASATGTRTTTATPTSSATATRTATPTATSTATATPTATSTASPTSTPTPAPDFGIAASPTSDSVRRGKTESYMITVTRLSGFAGSVKLSVSGLPPRSDASFNPSRATTTSKLKVHTPKGAADVGTFTLTITGASGGVQHLTSVQLTVTK